jgi:hypothetical protein
MSFYQKIYNNICINKSQLKEQYGYGSGLHRHRIIPGHMGGEYVDENITYLTVREHIIAHYLLWKIHKNVNDLRSMNMLGAKLTHKQRVVIGNWCYENNIGFHNPVYDEDKVDWRKRGLETQRKSYEENGNKESFYYWSTEDGRKERASMGGKATWESIKINRNGLPMCLSLDPEERKINASKAAKHSGKFPVTDGVICKKLKSETERQQFLLENPSFKSGGRPYTRKAGKGKSKMINNGVNQKVVLFTDLDAFLSDGWELGGLKIDQTIKMNNGIKNKRVPLSEKDYYLSLGWNFGIVEKRS